jgi:hypothetical protein
VNKNGETMNKMEKAFALFDGYNQQDPNKSTWEGIEYPTEYFYALRLYDWVRKLAPAAGDALLLASRCQHIGRWETPRTKYPTGKAGYYAWRTGLAKLHAETATRLLTEAGYGEDIIMPVRAILLKEQLRANPDMQVMENALCLVFLQFQYEDFLKKHEEEKIITILKKSWKKMSPPGRDAAFTLDFSEKGKELLAKAQLLNAHPRL